MGDWQILNIVKVWKTSKPMASLKMQTENLLMPTFHLYNRSFQCTAKEPFFMLITLSVQYKMIPDTAIAVHLFSVRKKQKETFTAFVLCNSDGSQKFELMFIGNTEKPRDLKGIMVTIIG